MKLDKNNINVFRKQIQDKLDELDIGLHLNLGNCTYNYDNATFKLNITVEGGQTKEEQDLEAIADIYKLNTSLVVKGYQLVGYKTRSTKKPFIVSKVGTNDKFIITKQQAEDMFKMENVNA
jgi:hypothetical protein